MRKLLLLLCVLWMAQTGCFFIRANENSPVNLLVEDGREWNILHYPEYCMAYGTPGCMTEIVFLEGDTLINDVRYQKMYHSYYKDKAHAAYIGGMRQEAGKVYSLDTDDKEELLYDFNIAVDDIIKIKDLELKLKEIKEADFNGATRKVYVFADASDDSPLDGEWIEGIGSVLGVLYIDRVNSPTSEVQLLSCRQREQVLFQNDRYEDDFMQRPYSYLLWDDTNWKDLYLSSLNPEYWGEYHYEFKGDTLVDGTVYRKLYCGELFVGGMFEDTDQKIYLRKMVNEDEEGFFKFHELKEDTTYLLYSFSEADWREGGSFEYLDYNYMAIKEITELDHITLLDGKEYLYTGDFIHSIGSVSGVFGNLGPHADNGEMRFLYEYSKGGKVIYKNDLTSIEKTDKEFAKVYTDASGNIVFSLDNSVVYKTIQLFDVEGRLIYSQLVEGEYELIIPGITRGLYLYKIEGKANSEDLYGKIAVFF